jgi:uncharacterized membrane protein
MFYLIAALLLYTVAILLTTVATRNLNSSLVTAIINAISAVIPIGVVISIANKKLFENARLGIILAVLTGIAIALFSLALNKSYSMNKVGIVSPIVFGGVIFLSSIIGSYFFKEKITMLQGIGLAFMGVGLLIIIYVKASGN